MTIQPGQENNILTDINYQSSNNAIIGIESYENTYSATSEQATGSSNGFGIPDEVESIDILEPLVGEEDIPATIDLSANTIQEGQLESDLENIFGSESNDNLVGNDNNNNLNGQGGKDTLTGGKGNDTFEFDNVIDSSLSNFDTITDFKIGEDQIVGVNGAEVAEATQFGAVSDLAETSIQAALNESEFVANAAGVFTVNTQTFLVLNNEVPGFLSKDDLVIEITGAITEAATDTVEPATDTIEPATDTVEPAEDTVEPAEDTVEPAEDTVEPATDTVEPATDTVEPVTGKTINVDSDFNGDLESAIASANDGDTIELSDKTYLTDGITVDNDITIDGQAGSVIDGGGTSASIFNLTAEATGATIQELRITNGNNGINSNGAFNLTLQSLELDNIGLSETIRDGQNNTGLILNRANGLQLSNTFLHDLGRKGVGINDTDGAVVSNLTVQNVNLAAQHAQSFDAAGIKLYNTNDVTLGGNNLSRINAYHIWNDTTNGTIIENNVIENVGNVFLRPSFNQNVDIAGIYDEKSSNSVVRGNRVTAAGGFLAFNATAFTTETLTLANNDFSSFELNTTDFWVNEELEKLIATTENPDEANFDLIADAFFAQANIG
jgi:RTX calcium-binding nonapeptide repeat (4 copies)